MPEITINQLNSDSQKVVEYANNSDLLETLLAEYDKKLNPKNTRLSIGNDLLMEWNLPIETCLHYGDSISIYTFLIRPIIEYKGRKFEIEIDSRRSILILKSVIKSYLNIEMWWQILTINETKVPIDENIEPLLYHNIRNGSCIHVAIRNLQREMHNENKCISINYCGKPTELAVCLNKDDDIFAIREKIFDSGINPEKYEIRISNKMLDQYRLTKHGKKYPEPDWKNVHSIDLYPKHVKGENSKLPTRPKQFECNKDAPEWQITKPGMCLEGLCENPECRAYNSKVIMNLPTPVIYKFGSPMETRTHCPVCLRFVKPLSVKFNNTDWRLLTLKDSEQGRIRWRSEWNYASHHEHDQLSESNLKEWDSLVIETKNKSKYLTTEFKCDLCLSHHEPIEGNIDDPSKCRHEFYDHYFYNKLKLSDNFFDYNF